MASSIAVTMRSPAAYNINTLDPFAGSMHNRRFVLISFRRRVRCSIFLPKKIMRCALGLYFILWEVLINPIVSTSVHTPRVQRQKEALLAFPCNVTRTIRMKTLSAAKLSFDNAFNFVDCICRCGLLSPPFRRGHIVITLTPKGFLT